MSEAIFAIIGIGIGCVVGGAIAWFYAQSKAGAATGALDEIKKQRDDAQTERDQLRGEVESERTAKVRAEAEREAATKRLEESEKLLEKTKKELKLEFENLANKIFEDKSKKFTDLNKSNVDGLIKPLREQLKDFSKKVDDVYVKEAKERTSLKTQIEQLTKLNDNLRQDAINLTNALKGQSKAQGNWGEMILTRILELSGLHEGREYELQESERNEDGNIRFLDALIRLPEGKQVVVDSKVSLNAYEAYCSADTDVERKGALSDHLDSVRTHVKGLGDKNYHDLPGVESLDFVLMFMPIESAFMLALEHDSKLFQDAFSQNIMIVSPSTLLLSLRIIANLWRTQDQNDNAVEIANEAGKLYDKFAGFVGDMEKVGSQLDTVQGSFGKAMNKLSTGTGNLIGRAEKLKKLGAKANKRLPERLVDKATGKLLEDAEEETEE